MKHEMTAEVWRYVPSANGRKLSMVRLAMPCTIVPASQVDKLPSYARDSDHVALFPEHVIPDLDVAVDDELRVGRYLPRGSEGEDPRMRRFFVTGVRRFALMGMSRTEAFLRESR